MSGDGEVVSLTMPGSGMAAALPEIDFRKLEEESKYPQEEIEGPPDHGIDRGFMEEKVDKTMNDDELRIYADDGKLKDPDENDGSGLGGFEEPNRSPPRPYPNLRSRSRSRSRSPILMERDRRSEAGSERGHYPREERRIDPEEIRQRAEIIAKLRRKIKFMRSNMEIPENATTEELLQAYNLLCYESKSQGAVGMMKSLYIHLNVAAENLAKVKPQLGLDLDKWGDYTATVCDSGQLDECFYQIYDEHPGWFETSGLIGLLQLWFATMLRYSASQKMAKELARQASLRRHQQRQQRQNPREQHDDDSNDMPGPTVTAEQLRALRREAASSEQRKPAMSTELPNGRRKGGAIDLSG